MDAAITRIPLTPPSYKPILNSCAKMTLKIVTKGGYNHLIQNGHKSEIITTILGDSVVHMVKFIRI